MSVFSIKLLDGCPYDEPSKLFGEKRTKTYKKFLNRAGKPEMTLQFMPQAGMENKYIIGRQSNLLFMQIENHFNTKSKKCDFLEDHEKEDGKTLENGCESEDSVVSSGDDDETRNDVELENVFFRSQENQNIKSTLLAKYEIAKSMSKFPDRYKPCPITDEELLKINDTGREAVVDAVPGLAKQPNAISKSRGGEDFFNYLGKWDNARPHGDGSFSFVDGGTYRGDWKQGYPHGKGIANYPNGSSFQGDWIQGIQHGQGIQIDVSGCIYTGLFFQGQRCGQGTLLFPLGTQYVGTFFDGLFHGRGVLKSVQGHKYDGEWSKGFILGSGTLILNDGTRIVQKWSPAQTLRDIVHSVTNEREEKARNKANLHLKLNQALEDMNLRRRVRRVRQRVIDAKETKVQNELEEINRLRYERREQMMKAKEAALKAVESSDED